jgi:hypothetical protein
VLVQGLHGAFSNAFASLLEHACNIASTLRPTVWQLYRPTIFQEMDADTVT